MGKVTGDGSLTRLVAHQPSMMPAVGRRRVLLRGAALFAFVAALVRLLRAFQSKRRLTAVRERHPPRPAGNEDGEPALVLAMASSLRPPPQIPPDSLQPKRCDSSVEVAALREQLAAAEGQRAAAEKERAAAVAALEEREVQAESDREGSKAAGEAEEAAKEAAKEGAAEAAAEAAEAAAEAAQADTSSPSLDTRHNFGEPLNTITSIDQSWPLSPSSSIYASLPPPPPPPPLPPPPLPLQTIYSGIDGLRIDVDHANGADGTNGVSPKSLGSLGSLDSLGSLGSLDTPRSATYAYGDTSLDTCVCGSGYRLPVGCIQGLDTCVCGPSMPSSPPAAAADIGTVCSLPRSTANESTSPLADTPRQRRTAVFRPVRGRADPEV